MGAQVPAEQLLFTAAQLAARTHTKVEASHSSYREGRGNTTAPLDSDFAYHRKSIMGSWVRTITTPFRKMLNSPQREQQGNKKASRHRRHQSSSGIVAPGDAVVDRTTTSSQLYGEVMACTYEDVQVMWSMLDKARICGAAAS